LRFIKLRKNNINFNIFRLHCYVPATKWVYNNKLQIKFMFRFGPMIFGRVMALGL